MTPFTPADPYNEVDPMSFNTSIFWMSPGSMKSSPPVPLWTFVPSMM